MSTRETYVGPRTPAPDQLEQVIALANKVFRANRGGNLREQFPLLYGSDHVEKLRIFEYEGTPVALIGTVIDDASLLGCDVRVASIGSVCTDPEHREKRMGSRLLDDAQRRSRQRGASVMLISGGRTLYTRRGAARCGLFHRYLFPHKLLPKDSEDLTITEPSHEGIPTALRMFEAEPIRFHRTLSQYTSQIAARWVMNRSGRTYLISRENSPVAVMSVSCKGLPRDGFPKTAVVCEMAGSRKAVVGALAKALEQLQLEIAVICAYPTDRAMADIAANLGVFPEKEGFEGTVKLLDAEKLWESFAPLLTRRIGQDALGRIRLRSESDELKIHTLIFESGDECIRIEGAEKIMCALFGSVELDPLSEYSGQLAETLRRALPLPLPMYGLNYV